MTNALQPAQSTTDAAGDLFLSGSYIELGISPWGNFGTTQGDTPAGYAQAGSQGVGLTYNEAGFGVNSSIPTIDFFTPGSPFEGFAAGYTMGGTNSYGTNYKDGGLEGITPVSMTNESSGSHLAAQWVGILDGDLRVTLNYSFNATDLFFATTVTLTNISSSTMSDVRYDRQVDPDNTVYAGGSYATNNTIVAQQPGSGASEVTAVSSVGDPYYTATGSTASIMYYSTNPDTRVSDGIDFGGAVDPFDAAYSTSAGAAGSTTGLSDTAININYDGGSLAAGASTSFTYYTALTSDVSTVLNAIAQAAPTVALDPGSDSGVVGDGITNVADPTIDGTGNAGDTVTVYDSGTEIGTTTVGTDDSWSFSPGTLADGTHSLTATETSSGGTVSDLSFPVAVTIDTTPPDAPGTLALATASDSGVVGDGITNVADPTITGTGAAGDTVTLYDGATAIATATVAGDGTWSATPTSALTDGSHTITATQTDVAGNVSAASAALALTIETTPPAAPGTLALAAASDSGVVGDDITNVADPMLTGTGLAGDTITLYDGTTPVGTATVADDGTWSVAPGSALADGTHNLTATQTDAAGNVSAASAALAVTIVTSAPAPGTLALAAGSDSGVVGDDITNVADPTLTGTGAAGDTITLYDGATAVGTATVADDGTWSVTPGSALADGTHTLTATQTDVAGNISPASAALAVTIDTIPPAAPGAPALAAGSDSGVPGDDITNVTSPTLTGTGEPGDTITLYDGTTAVGTATVGDDGTWSATVGSTLADGTHNLTATQTDPAGNASPASAPFAVTIATTPPAAPGGLALTAASDSGVPGDDITNVTDPTLTGTGAIGDTITLYDDGSEVGTTTVGTDGTWSIDTGVLPAGVHTITAAQTDAVGNVSALAGPLPLTIATAAPPAPVGLALALASDSGVLGDHITNVTNPTLTGTGVTGDTITLYDGTAVVGSGTVGAGGTWSIASTTLASGVHHLTATQTDVAGNVSPATAAMAVTIDTTPPPAPSLGLTPATDSGVQGDDITNVADPTLTGTGAPGNTIALYNGATRVGTAVVALNGTWSITPSAPLAAGANALTATATDAVGNTASTNAVITIDAAAPAAPDTLALAAGSDSGVVGDGITNVADPTLTGNGAAGDTVALYDGATQVGTATVGNDGTWSVTPGSPLTDGTHTLTAVQTDVAGNVSPASAPLAVTIMTATPDAPAGLTLSPDSDSGVPGDDITNVADPTLTGTGDVGDTVTLYDGSNPVATATVGDDGTWSAAPDADLADGTHTLTATETDIAGNVSPGSAALAVTIVTSAPAPGAMALAADSDSGVVGDDITNVADPTLNGTGQAGDIITLYDGTTQVGTATVGDDGTWSASPDSDLADGTHTLTATQTDIAGNVSGAGAPLVVTIATSQPTVTAGLADDGYTLTGTADPNSTVTVTEGGDTVGTVQSNASGAWSFDPSGLNPGPASLVASETDVAGNTGSSAAVEDDVPDGRFMLTDTGSMTSSSLIGENYTGPVSYLDASYSYSGSSNIVLSARTGNVFMHGGNGSNALQAMSGSNVLAGGAGSNWLVGATGTDGGDDTFFLTGGGDTTTWNTLLNFHVGDALTIWGFNPTSGSDQWIGNKGTPGYTGATLAIQFGGDSTGTTNVTFAGLPTGTGKFSIATGESGGHDYLMVTRTA